MHRPAGHDSGQETSVQGFFKVCDRQIHVQGAERYRRAQEGPQRASKGFAEGAQTRPLRTQAGESRGRGLLPLSDGETGS